MPNSGRIYKHKEETGLIYQKSSLLDIIVEQALVEEKFYKRISDALNELKNKGTSLINRIINKK